MFHSTAIKAGFLLESGLLPFNLEGIDASNSNDCRQCDVCFDSELANVAESHANGTATEGRSKGNEECVRNGTRFDGHSLRMMVPTMVREHLPKLSSLILNTSQKICNNFRCGAANAANPSSNWICRGFGDRNHRDCLRPSCCNIPTSEGTKIK